MARPEKELTVAKLAEQIRQAGSLLLTDYRGLTVRQMAQLRRVLRSRGTRYRVIKNTLFRRALEACGRAELSPLAEGPTAVALISGEPPAVIKELLAYSKTANDLPVVKGGLVEGRLLSAAEVIALASLPSREQLLALLVSLLQAPLANVVATLQAAPARLAALLHALAEKKAAESAPA